MFFIVSTFVILKELVAKFQIHLLGYHQSIGVYCDKIRLYIKNTVKSVK